MGNAVDQLQAVICTNNQGGVQSPEVDQQVALLRNTEAWLDGS